MSRYDDNYEYDYGFDDIEEVFDEYEEDDSYEDLGYIIDDDYSSHSDWENYYHNLTNEIGED